VLLAEGQGGTEREVPPVSVERDNGAPASREVELLVRDVSRVELVQVGRRLSACPDAF